MKLNNRSAGALAIILAAGSAEAQVSKSSKGATGFEIDRDAPVLDRGAHLSRDRGARAT